MSPTEVEALELRLLLDAIHERYGYDLREYDRASIQRRMRLALAKSGLSHLGELLHHVLRDPALFALVLDELTVRVSEMFRSPPFYRAFRERVLPMLRTYPQIKLWHAGCANGEEVYTSAILLLEENLYERTQIYATDMSRAALDQAREGTYPEASLAVFAENYAKSGGRRSFDEYYTAAYGRIVVREALRRNIVFFQHDLVSDYVFGEMQVVFCRNVLIYFTPALRERILQVIAHGLCRGGFLCLGESEHLPPSLSAWFEDYAPAERIYRRRGQA
ncbi:MAG TPA: protein-glutamate O-methyltransferase CheR [Polyangiaceae bacterium]|nr:protein-glutamate O-methyltransferase CheR [Polyangiaceae bacterium]